MTLTVEDRHDRLHRLLGLRRHSEGCPGEDGTGPMEAFQEILVASVHPDLRGVAKGSPVVVVRCVTCAGCRYFEGRVDDVLDRVAS